MGRNDAPVGLYLSACAADIFMLNWAQPFMAEQVN